MCSQQTPPLWVQAGGRRVTHPGAPLYLSPLAQAPLKHRVSCSGSNGKARNGDKVSVKRKERTNLEIRHVVLQQGPGGLDVFFSTHKHKGNHALMKDKKKGQIMIILKSSKNLQQFNMKWAQKNNHISMRITEQLRNDLNT